MADYPTATKEARKVIAHIDDKGVVQEVKDPDFAGFWEPDTRLDTQVEQEHYGWKLKEYIDKGIHVNLVLPGEAEICVNDPDDATHMNTLTAQPPKLVKMDLGFWAEYHRGKSPAQRNFGMIQGHDVWLCNFTGTTSSFSNDKDMMPDDDSPAGKLLAYLKDKGLHVDVLQHALAPCGAFTADLDADTLYVMFSDLHLPERLPNEPIDAMRPPTPDAPLRQELRAELRKCQHSPGLISFSKMSSAQLEYIQDYLENAANGAPDDYVALSKKNYGRDSVLAEKNILDRTIRTRCCWVFGPKKGDEKSEDGDHEDKKDFAVVSSAPGVDLATFLAAVLVTRDQKGANIKVIQVGDLYELWMGREFLYVDFPHNGEFSKASIANALLLKFAWLSFSHNDDFQYRFDKDWLDGADAHGLKRYPFHEWSTSDMLKRRKTGWDFCVDGAPDEELLAAAGLTDKVERAKDLLAERVQGVHDFSLPLPVDWDDGKKTKYTGILEEAGLKLDDFAQTDIQPIDKPLEGHYKWNDMVLNLFQQLGFDNIHGNHDGYRSDPFLSAGMGIPAKEWISLPGIWIEHGHRWDEFNRDGCAFGAGMTNMVYYQNKFMVESEGGFVTKYLFPQEQKCTQPGFAQWYLLVNMTNNVFKSRDKSDTVLPFGIVVSGHTHNPDLCYIEIEKEGGFLAGAMALAKDAEKLAKDAKKKLEDAEAKAKALEEAAKKKVQDLANSAKGAVQAVENKAKAAEAAIKAEAEAAKNKLKNLF